MITFLLKGLLRDRSRSLFPVLMVSAGVFLTVFLYSYLKGVIGDMVDSSARFDTGHVKIMTRAYSKLSDQMPNDLALLSIEDLLKRIKTDHPEMIWTPRIKFNGLIDIPDENNYTRSQGPVFGIGVDLLGPAAPDVKILNLKKSLVRGRLPQHKNEILISDVFARKLGVTLGETATLIGSTMHGSMTMHNFKVVGSLRFGMNVLDRSTIIADIEDVRTALDMADGAGEIVGYTKDLMYSDKTMFGIAQIFNETYSIQNDEFSPLMLKLSEQGGHETMLQMANLVGGIIVAVFVLAMSIVLWNAGLMNGLRRYGEIGLRLAMGESKARVYRFMIFESICLGVIGSLFGTALGLAASYWLQYSGLDIGDMMQKSTIMISNVIHARVTLTSYYIGFLPGVFASVLGAMAAGIGVYKRQTAQLFRELEV